MKTTLRRSGYGLIVATILALLTIVLTPGLASAASHKLTSRGSSSGAKATIKVGRGSANANPKKGGKSRSGILHVDSHSEYYIDIYVDGVYQGTVAPYGDLYIEDYDNVSSVYGEASGTSYVWPTESIAVPGEWDLY